MALDTGLSVATGIAADRLRRGLLTRGSATAVIVGLAGAAAAKATVVGAVQAVGNVRHGRAWTAGVASHVLDGLRTGMIDGTLSVVAGPIHQSVGRRFPRLGCVAHSAVSGLVIGAVGGAAYRGTDLETWRHGVGEGLRDVGVATAVGAGGGALLGAVAGGVARWWGSRGRAVTAGEPSRPSAQAFQQRYPHHPEAPGQAQTTLRVGEVDYHVSGYDPSSGTVGLFREITLEADLADPVLQESLSSLKGPLKVGQLLQVEGQAFEVRAVDLAQSGRVLLRHTVRSKLSWREFSRVASDPQNVRLSAAGVAVDLDKPSATDALRDFLGLERKRLVALVGREQVQLLQQSTQAVEYPMSAAPLDPQKVMVIQELGDDSRSLVDVRPTPSTVYQFRVGQGPQAPIIEVAVPLTASGQSPAGIVDEITDLLAALPEQHANAQGFLRFNRDGNVFDAAWRRLGVFSDQQVSVASAGGMTTTPHGRQTPVIDFYHVDGPLGPASRLGAIQHETGHEIARKLWGSAMPPAEWSVARNADGLSASAYAETSIVEDFAETVRCYVDSDAGRLQPDLRLRLRHRFEALDRIFGLPTEQVDAHVDGTLRMRQARIAIGGTIGVGAATAIGQTVMTRQP